MKITVNIASPLRKTTDGNSSVAVEAKNVKELLQNLQAAYPALIQTICDENLSLKPVVSLYVDDEEINYLAGSDTVLTEKSSVHIIPTIAGG